MEHNRSQGGPFLQGHKLHLSPALQAWPSVGKAEASVVSGGEGGGDALLHGVPAESSWLWSSLNSGLERVEGAPHTHGVQCITEIIK